MTTLANKPFFSILFSLLTLGVIAQSSRHACLMRSETYLHGNPSTAINDFNGDGYLDIAMQSESNMFGEFVIIWGQSDGNFSAPQYFNKNSKQVGILWLEMADINHDKNQDIITLIYSSPSYYFNVFYSDGKGNFSKPDSISTQSANSNQFAKGDFNEDGHIDFAIIENYLSIGGTNKIVIMYGDTTDKFTGNPVVIGSTGGYKLFCDDVNGDLHDDILLIGESKTEIYAGDGKGAFANPLLYTTGTPQYNTRDLVVTDLNADGKKDLAVASAMGSTLLINDGKGAFTSKKLNEPGGQSIAVGDINLDGKLDVITVGSYNNGNGIANGLGTLNFDALYPFGEMLMDWNYIKVVDFNKDGYNDLFGMAAGSVEICINSGPGEQPVDSFYVQSYKNITCNSYYNGTATVVAKGGKTPYTYFWGYGLKSATATGLGPGTYTVFVSGANGCLSSTNVTITEPQLLEVALSSRINCGADVYITANVTGGTKPYKYKWSNKSFFDTSNIDQVSSTGTYNLMVLDANKCRVDGTQTMQLNPRFASEVSFNTAPNPGLLFHSDLNKDGWTDIISLDQNSNQISVLKANGPGTFAATENFYAGTYPNSMVLADFDNDGNNDAVVVSLLQANDTLLLLKGNGKGGFASPISILTGYKNSKRKLAAGDLNGDGKTDLVLVGGGGKGYCILINNGASGFTINTTTDKSYHFGAAIADVNHDGKSDILTVETYDGKFTVMLGNGSGGILSSSRFNAYNGNENIIIDYIDSDNNLDVLFYGFQGEIEKCFGDGNGAFGIPRSLNIYSATSVVCNDFNNDGIKDIACSNSNGTAFIALISSGGGITSSVVIGNNQSSVGITSGDFDHDGKLDIALSRPQNNLVGILLNCTTELSVAPNIELLDNFKLFPNPTTDLINVSIEKDMVGGMLRIIDFTGRIVYLTTLNETNATILLHNFQPGMYMVSYTDLSGKQSIHKLLVK